LTLSGLVIGFNLERDPTDKNGNIAEPKEVDIKASRVSTINLTPRLVAKLLTQSYWDPYRKESNPYPSDYAWINAAPRDITFDPDFLQFNPEFTVMSIGSHRTVATAFVEAASSDAARAAWDWILADPEAKAWLDGNPDPWGMKVNPYYATTAANNKNSAAFADPVPDTFPKNDPYCYQYAALIGNVVPRPLCLLDTEPYSISMVAAAQATRSANDGATVGHDPNDPTHATSNNWWQSDGPQPLGQRSMLSITDSASAARYGLQTASLSRAGDDGSNRAFVAPNTDAFVKGADAMVPSQDDKNVLVPDPTVKAPGAYPLTLLTYAATFPKALDQISRNDYAAFVDYATTDGQEPGVAFGQLPPGYAPLPASLVKEAKDATAAVRAGGPPTVSLPIDDTPPTTTAPANTPPTNTPPSTAPSSPSTTASTTTSQGGATGTSAPQGTAKSAPRQPTAAASTPTALAPITSTPVQLASLPPTGQVDLAPGEPAGSSSATLHSPGKTPVVKAAAILRYAIPLLLAVALVAILAVLILDDRWLRRVARGTG
jgi:hypothetical protein